MSKLAARKKSRSIPGSFLYSLKLMTMKVIIMLVCSLLISLSSIQAQSKWYNSFGAEMLFSFADIADQGQEASSLMRWAPVLNLYTYANKDFSQHLGFYAGLSVLNVGYIYDGYVSPSDQVAYKKKFRTYNLAIPVGLKIGHLDRMFLFGGYSLEFPFVYKEKTFDGGDKIGKIVGWFSSRYEPIQHGFHVGVQLPEGLTVNFKYYVSEFHHQDFTEGSGVRPYEGLESHIFYFSLSYKMLSRW
jgi:hypothetical protein